MFNQTLEFIRTKMIGFN